MTGVCEDSLRSRRGGANKERPEFGASIVEAAFSTPRNPMKKKIKEVECSATHPVGRRMGGWEREERERGSVNKQLQPTHP